jgi:hypothetical protein
MPRGVAQARPRTALARAAWKRVNSATQRPEVGHRSGKATERASGRRSGGSQYERTAERLAAKAMPGSLTRAQGACPHGMEAPI